MNELEWFLIGLIPLVVAVIVLWWAAKTYFKLMKEE